MRGPWRECGGHLGIGLLSLIECDYLFFNPAMHSIEKYSLRDFLTFWILYFSLGFSNFCSPDLCQSFLSGSLPISSDEHQVFISFGGVIFTNLGDLDSQHDQSGSY